MLVTVTEEPPKPSPHTIVRDESVYSEYSMVLEPDVSFRVAKVAPAPPPTLSEMVYGVPLAQITVMFTELSMLEGIIAGIAAPKDNAGTVTRHTPTTVPVMLKVVVTVVDAHAGLAAAIMPHAISAIRSFLLFMVHSPA
jgi:hypothetical protein